MYKSILFEIKKILTWKLLLGFVTSVLVSVTLFMIFYSSSQEENWKRELNQKIEASEIWIAEINQDDELSLEDKTIMIEKEEELINVWRYHLENNISDSMTLLSFVYDSYALNAILILFSIYLASKILSVEYKLKTLEPLLLRNVSKRKIMTFKLLSLLISITFLQILFLFLLVSVGILFFINNGISNPIVFSVGNEIIQKSPISQILFATSISILVCTSYAIAVFMLSTFITNQTVLAFFGILFYISGGVTSEFFNESLNYNSLVPIYTLQYIEKQINSVPIINAEFLNNLVSVLFYNILFITISYKCFNLSSLHLLQRIKKDA